MGFGTSEPFNAQGELKLRPPKVFMRWLALDAAGEAWGHAGEAAEVSVEVALVGETDGEGDMGQRKLRVAEHLLDVLEAAAKEIPVGRHANRLLEGAGEMVRRESCHGGQSAEADLLTDVRLDEIADAVFHGRREAASVQVWRFGHGHEAEHAQPRLRVNNSFRPVAGGVSWARQWSLRAARARRMGMSCPPRRRKSDGL
jgi:hypothetical protein